jgi:hypothetical protein
MVPVFEVKKEIWVYSECEEEVASMKTHPLFHGFCHFPMPRRASVTLVALFALASSSPAFCGEIHEAAKNGDVAKVGALLKHNPALVFSKAKEYYGATPLHLAAGWGHKDVAQLLLDFKAVVDARNDHGYTPLYMAARSGHKDVVELLLANGADVNAKDSEGQTPLGAVLSLIRMHPLPGEEDVALLLRQHGGQDSAVKQPSTFVSSAVPTLAETPPAGYVSMPQGINCVGYDTTQAGQEGTGWTLQSIGSLRCGTSGASVTSYKEVALISHDVIGGRIQTRLFGTFVVSAQPTAKGSSTLSGAGVQFGPGGSVTPLSTDERPSTYATNQSGASLQLAISQSEVQAFSEFLQVKAFLTLVGVAEVSAQGSDPYPYRGPETLMILHIAEIDGQTVKAWGKAPENVFTYAVSEKVKYCKLDAATGKSVRVSDWSYLNPKIDAKEFVTFKLSRNLKKVDVVWDGIPPGHPYVMRLAGPNYPTPITQRGTEYGFPPMCR